MWKELNHPFERFGHINKHGGQDDDDTVNDNNKKVNPGKQGRCAMPSYKKYAVLVVFMVYNQVDYMKQAM
jgi:hypothetical protein